jgi:hypothetical protein
VECRTFPNSGVPLFRQTRRDRWNLATAVPSLMEATLRVSASVSDTQLTNIVIAIKTRRPHARTCCSPTSRHMALHQRVVPRSLLVSDRRPLKSRSRRRDLNAAFMGGALCLQKWSKPCLLQCVERAVGSGFESIQHISGVKLFTARAIMCRKSLALRPPQFH